MKKQALTMFVAMMATVLVLGACVKSSVITVYADANPAVDGDSDSQPDGDTAFDEDGDTAEAEEQLVDGDSEVEADTEVIETADGDTTEAAEEAGCKTNDDCNDGVACTIDECNLCTGECTNKPSDAYCNNKNPCQVGSCNVETGGCDFEQRPEGTKCASDDKCAWNACDASGQCVFVEQMTIGGMEFCEMCESDADCKAYVDCAGGEHIWGIEHLPKCDPNGTCATREVAENSADPEEAAIWVANCKQQP